MHSPQLVLYVRLTGRSLQINQHLGHHGNKPEECKSHRTGSGLSAVVAVTPVLIAGIHGPVAGSLPTGRAIRAVFWLAVKHCEYGPRVHMSQYFCRILICPYGSCQPVGNSDVACLVGECGESDAQQRSSNEGYPESCKHNLRSMDSPPRVSPLAYFLTRYRPQILAVVITDRAS